MFIGFESAANLAEETANPKRHIPRAVLLSLTVVGLYYLVTAYAQDVGFGLDAVSWQNSVFPLQSLASGDEFGSGAFGDFVAAIIILDVIAVTIGVGVAVTRGMLSMARDGRLPTSLAVVHRKFRTPARCTALLGAVAVLAVLVVALGDGVLSRATGEPGVLQPQWAPAFGWMAGFGGLGLALMYLVVSAVGVKGLWHEVSRVKLLVAAIVGVTVAAGAVFGAVYQAPSPLNTVPLVLLGWVALGVAWSFFVLRRRSTPDADHTAAPTASVGD